MLLLVDNKVWHINRICWGMLLQTLGKLTENYDSWEWYTILLELSSWNTIFFFSHRTKQPKIDAENRSALNVNIRVYVWNSVLCMIALKLLPSYRNPCFSFSLSYVHVKLLTWQVHCWLGCTSTWCQCKWLLLLVPIFVLSSDFQMAMQYK